MEGDTKRAQLCLDLERLGPTQTKSLTVSEFMAEIEAFTRSSCQFMQSMFITNNQIPCDNFFLSLTLGIY